MSNVIFHSSSLGTVNFFYLTQRFKFESLEIGESRIENIELQTTKGMIATVKIQSNSENLDLHLVPFKTAEDDSILVIYKKLGINKISMESGLNEFWSKYSQLDGGNVLTTKDNTIFVKLLNNGPSPTGDIYLELVYQVFK